MIRVRILHPTAVRLALEPGDEVLQQTMTPELRAFLGNTRVDGQRVAVICDDADVDEVATLPPAPETTMVRGRRSSRSAPARDVVGG